MEATGCVAGHTQAARERYGPVLRHSEALVTPARERRTHAAGLDQALRIGIATKKGEISGRGVIVVIASVASRVQRVGGCSGSSLRLARTHWSVGDQVDFAQGAQVVLKVALDSSKRLRGEVGEVNNRKSLEKSQETSLARTVRKSSFRSRSCTTSYECTSARQDEIALRLIFESILVLHVAVRSCPENIVSESVVDSLYHV